MKDKHVLVLMMMPFLMCTPSQPCPTPPDSLCQCERPLNINRTCYSIQNNETIFRAKYISSCMFQRNCLNLWCRNEEYLDDYFDMPIPKFIQFMQIDNCSFTEKWTINLLNSNVNSLRLTRVNNFHFERNKALFRKLPNLRELRVYEIISLNLTSQAFQYIPNLILLDISSFHLEIPSRHPFVYLHQLEDLDLSSNNINVLSDSIFHDLLSLKRLHLNNNRLEKIPENLFVQNVNLLMLNIGHNTLTELPQNLLSRAKNLEELYINNNPLKQIPRDIIQNKMNLTNFDLSDCNLTSMPENLLENVTKLRSLYLQRNKLNLLTNIYFKTNPLLWIIDLSSNDISELVDSPFQYNPELSELLLGGNRLENITRKDFSGLIVLDELDISNNLISNIEENSFQDLTNMDQLNLKQNRLKLLKAEYFEANTLLRKLYLSSNEISQLLNSPFRFNTELRELYLKGNKLSNISRSDFSGLISLETLDVSNNVLGDIEEFSFEDLMLLKRLDISQNFLKVIPHLHHPNKTISLSLFIANDNNVTEFPNIIGYGNLKELRLERNRITSLSIPRNLFPKNGNTYIYLQNNSIETINVDSIKSDHSYDYDYEEMMNKTSLRKKVLFHLEGNRLICDCHLHEFREYISRKIFCLRHVLFSDVQRLICEAPRNLKGQIMHELHGDAFLCPVTEKCPTGCRCTFRKSDSAVIMRCDGLEMNALPEIIPENIRILHLENNNLKGLQEFRREEFENLTELYVDGNQLSSENCDQWHIPMNLQILSVTKNNLHILPESIKRHAERMKNFQIYLRNNSWKCDCFGAELRHWIHGHVEQAKDMNEILCMKDSGDGKSPTFLKLIKVTHNFLCPFDHSPFIRTRIVGASVIVVFGFICFVSVIFYNMNKKKVLSYIYIHFPCLFEYPYRRNDLNSDKTFDAFISYSSDDRDVVVKICDELEKKEPYYRLCIHERDWIAGDYITENIVCSVKNSRKTILIISKTFLESRWCDLEFEVAYNQTLKDKMSRLILIVKGDLPPKNTINEDLRFMLSTKSYIEWGEVNFWVKLRSALPHHSKEKEILHINERFSTNSSNLLFYKNIY